MEIPANVFTELYFAILYNGSHWEKKGSEVRKRYILRLFRALGLKHLLIGITVMLQKLVLSISKKDCYS